MVETPVMPQLIVKVDNGAVGDSAEEKGPDLVLDDFTWESKERFVVFPDVSEATDKMVSSKESLDQTEANEKMEVANAVVKNQGEMAKDTIEAVEDVVHSKVDNGNVAANFSDSSTCVAVNESTKGKESAPSILGQLSLMINSPTTKTNTEFLKSLLAKVSFEKEIVPRKSGNVVKDKDLPVEDFASRKPQRPKEDPTLEDVFSSSSWYSKNFGANKEVQESRSSRTIPIALDIQSLPTISSWTKTSDGCITGVIENSADFESGTEICTAPVVEVSTLALNFGRKATIAMTISGSRYRLMGAEVAMEQKLNSFKDASSLGIAPGYEFVDVDVDGDGDGESDVNKVETNTGFINLSFPSFRAMRLNEVAELNTPVEETKETTTLAAVNPFSSLLSKQTRDPSDADNIGKEIAGVAKQTLFGNRKKKKSESEEVNAVASSPARPAFSFFGKQSEKIAVLSEWEQNLDGSITGIVSDREGFEDGTLITTSPVKTEAKKGRIVTTTGGSKYQLS